MLSQLIDSFVEKCKKAKICKKRLKEEIRSLEETITELTEKNKQDKFMYDQISKEMKETMTVLKQDLYNERNFLVKIESYKLNRANSETNTNDGYLKKLSDSNGKLMLELVFSQHQLD